MIDWLAHFDPHGEGGRLAILAAVTVLNCILLAVMAVRIWKDTRK